MTLQQLQEVFRRPVPCHAKMTNFAEDIRIAGQPFAVLHGGQIRPSDPEWRIPMKQRLLTLLPNQSDTVEGLLKLVDQMKEETEQERKTRREDFHQFATEFEHLLQHAYQQRRDASEETLLKEILEFLTEEPIIDPSSWWSKVSEMLANLCPAIGVKHIGLFLGGNACGKVFELLLKAASENSPFSRTSVNVGPHWQAIRHKPLILTDQQWAGPFRSSLGSSLKEPCSVATFICHAGDEAKNVFGMLVVLGEGAQAASLLPFLGKLTTELGRRITTVHLNLERQKIQQQFAEVSAYSHHDLKFPLQVAMTLAESIQHDMLGLKPRDYKLESNVEDLLASLSEARDKCKPMEKLPIREVTIKCLIKPIDVIPLVDKTIKMAHNLGAKNDVIVKWVDPPSTPVIVNADEAYLSTALYALFENAVKYSFNQKEVRVYALFEKQWFTLRISDFGVGLTPEDELALFEFGSRARIEEKFRGKSREGAGLGLAFAYRIIKEHGGDLKLTSVPSENAHDYLSYEVSAHVKLPLFSIL